MEALFTIQLASILGQQQQKPPLDCPDQGLESPTQSHKSPAKTSSEENGTRPSAQTK